MPALYGRDGVLGVQAEPDIDIPEGHAWACPKPECDTPHDFPGDCPEHWISLVEIGPDGMEVT